MMHISSGTYVNMAKLREFLSSTRMRLIVGSIGLLLIGGVIGSLIVVMPAMAAGHQNSTTPTPTPAPSKTCQIYEQTLAKQLGVTQQHLEQANQTALKAAIQQAVTDGKLTQAQANQIEQKTAANSSVCHLGDVGSGRHSSSGTHNGAFTQARQAVVTAVAAKLGISADTLKTDIKNGQDIVTLASQHNVSKSTLNSIILSTVQTQLKNAVSAGTITSQQFQHLQTVVTNQINAGHYGIVGLTKPKGA
jgi:hypothetical protein